MWGVVEMTITTLRPTAIHIDRASWVLNGGGTKPAALADDSDTTFLRATLAGGSNSISFLYDELSIPAGAKLIAVRQRVRARQVEAPVTDQGFYLSLHHKTTGVRYNDYQWLIWSGFFTYTQAWQTVPQPGFDVPATWTVDNINALVIRVWRLGTKEIDIAEWYLDVDYNERPVAAYTGPTGVVSDTSRPTVTWDYSDPEEDPQQAFRVLVREDDSSGAIVYDSGWISSSMTQHQLPNLNNDATYWTRVEVRQAWGGDGTHGSDPNSAAAAGTFTLDLDTAAAPTFAVTPEHDDARVRLDLDDPGTTEPPAEWYTVEFRDHADDPWTAVRGAEALPSDNPVVHYDYEAPFGRTREYRATAFIDVDGNSIGSPRAFDDATLVTDGRWVTDVVDPEMFHAEIAVLRHERQWNGREVVHRPVGMGISVVESEPTTRRDSVSVWSFDPVTQSAIVSLVRSTRPLLYRDRRDSFYFRWVGVRTSSQVSWDGANADVHSAEMVEIARPG